VTDTAVTLVCLTPRRSDPINRLEKPQWSRLASLQWLHLFFQFFHNLSQKKECGEITDKTEIWQINTRWTVMTKDLLPNHPDLVWGSSVDSE